MSNILEKVKAFISTKDKNTQITKEIKGIDISSYQSNVSWEKVATTDVKFVILRGTTKNEELDKYFWKNYNGAKTYGFKDISVYHFSYALTIDKAIFDAKNLINKLNGEKIPIWLDLEWTEQGKLGKDKITEIAIAFIKTCKENGYECNIYSNLDWYKNYYYADKLKALDCKFWIARYGTNDGFIQKKYKPNIGEYIWQYTSNGEVSGINGYVDMNIKYETISCDKNEDINKIQKLVKIICNSVYKRNTPTSSIDSNKVGIYKNGDIIEVNGITKNKLWYKDINGNYFTSNKKYVSDLIGIVFNCYKLNLRESNSTKSKILEVLNKNEKVVILKEYDKWYYVKTENENKGYVSKSYIKLL